MDGHIMSILAGHNMTSPAVVRRFQEAVRAWDEARAAMQAAMDESDLVAVTAALTSALKISSDLRDFMVIQAKKQPGVTWQEIGEALQTPRQVAWRKYNPRL